MANECTVWEMRQPRLRTDIRVVPFLARTVLSDNGTVTLNKSTVMITVKTTLAGSVTFTETDGTAPDGTNKPFLMNINQEYDFDVRGGTVMRFDT